MKDGQQYGTQGSPAPRTPASMLGGNAAPGGGEGSWKLAPTHIPDGSYAKAILKWEIKVTKLNADNYIAWAHNMEAMLDAKDLLRHVLGTEPTPDPITRPKDHKAWWFGDKQARMWIRINCEDQQHAHIDHAKTSKAAWDAPKQVHGTYSQ